MNPEKGHFKLLFCTQGKNVDSNPVSNESVPHSPTHTSTYTQVQGLGKVSVMQIRWNSGNLMLSWLSWAGCDTLGKSLIFCLLKHKRVDGPSQDFSVDNWGMSKFHMWRINMSQVHWRPAHASFSLSWKLDDVPVEWCNLVKLNLSNSKWHV